MFSQRSLAKVLFFLNPESSFFLKKKTVHAKLTKRFKEAKMSPFHGEKGI